MSYQFQVDFGFGYEDVFPDVEVASSDEQLVAFWLATIEAEGDARRVRVLLGGQVIVERTFDCVVVESQIQPDGSTRHLVHCEGGEVIVYEHTDGSFSGSVQSGFVGEVSRAIQRARKAVEALKDTGGT